MSQQCIAFQGELGANSHEACQTYFPDHSPVPHPTFEEAFEAVKSGACQLGMIPVETPMPTQPDILPADETNQLEMKGG